MSTGGERVILRVGGRSRPGSSTQPLAGVPPGYFHAHAPTPPPSEPNHATYSRLASSTGQQYTITPQQYHPQSQQQYTIFPQSNAVTQSYPAYQPPARSDSTHSLPAANEIYTISRGGSAASSSHPTPSQLLAHSSSMMTVANYAGQQNVRPTSGTQSQAISRSMSRASSTAALPLAVALASDSINIAPSNLSPEPVVQASSTSTSTALVTTNGSSSSSSSASSASRQVITVPSLLSPDQRIDVPLIRWSEVAPPELGLHTEKTTSLKQEFHGNLKNFLKQAKESIDELTAELFYEEENEEDDDVGDEETEGESTPAKAKRSTSQTQVTSASLSSASATQLGSPRKSALLQQLVQLSAHMDTGIAQIQAAREAALKRAKEGKSAHSASSVPSAPRFNKTDIAQLAALARDTATAIVSEKDKSSNKPAAGRYPAVSDASKDALAAFVRRSQLNERHRAYEQWVAQKAAAQEKALARQAKEAKLERLRQLAREREQQQLQQTHEEEERARAEEEALARELEAQRLAEEAEERTRQEHERQERARLEAERRAREEQRRAEREAEAARTRLEAEMHAREEEERAWAREKAAKEAAENEALRLTEELKREVAKDLALVTAQAAERGGAGAQVDVGDDAHEEAELDALFLAATRPPNDADGNSADVPEETAGGEEDLDTDEEFGEFGSPRTTAAAKARASRSNAAAAAAASTARAAPTATAAAGRKGRTVARTAGSTAGMPFVMPVAPSLPSSVTGGGPRGSPRTAAATRPMLFGGGGSSGPAPSTNYQFERAKRMHAR